MYCISQCPAVAFFNQKGCRVCLYNFLPTEKRISKHLTWTLVKLSEEAAALLKSLVGNISLKFESYMEAIYREVRTAVDLCHRDGSLKQEVASDPGKYIHEVRHSFTLSKNKSVSPPSQALDLLLVEATGSSLKFPLHIVSAAGDSCFSIYLCDVFCPLWKNPALWLLSSSKQRSSWTKLPTIFPFLAQWQCLV